MSSTASSSSREEIALALVALSPLLSKRSQRRTSQQLAAQAPYEAVQRVAELVVTESGAEWVARLFRSVEDVLAEKNKEAVEFMAFSLFEDVQNFSSHGDTAASPRDFMPMLGPLSAKVWAAVDQIWATVGENLDEVRTRVPSTNEEPLTPERYQSLQNPELRRIIRSIYRRLPDGTYVSVADVLVYETIHGGGPHLRKSKGA